MPYQCHLVISPWAKPSGKKNHKGKPLIFKVGDPHLNEVSPLIFDTEEEAKTFGRKIFEPPLSVAAWEVQFTEQPANFK